jgi:pyruvate/2-oxoglutarate dehydrogenase complex dihydrolipoamide dehydrogenase (E3) component
MSTTEHYDILVFGGGIGGKVLAMDQARAGKRVAMVEIGMIGGSCINVACIPSKSLIRSAEIAALTAHAAEFGTFLSGATRNMTRIAARTADIVDGLVQANRQAFDASGLKLVLGRGRFVEPRVVEVATEHGPRHLSGERIYLNLGTEAAIPPIPGLAEAAPLTHVSALKLDVLPQRLIVLGGGYVGLEMAQAFRRLGSEVVLLERSSQLVAREDPDFGEGIQAILEEDGVEVLIGSRTMQVGGRSGDRVSVRLEDGCWVEGSHLLVAAGRRPRTDGIGLDIAGVELDAKGFVQVDERLQTTAEAIWALGEAAGSPMFTHVSLDDYRVAKAGIEGGAYTTADRLVPSCLFIDPEFARVGLSEEEAKRKGIPHRIVRFPMAAVPRARTLSQRQGFMKAVVSTDDQLHGFAMLGPRAGEVMSVVQTAMTGGLGATALRDTIFAHPTMTESLNFLFLFGDSAFAP